MPIPAVHGPVRPSDQPAIPSLAGLRILIVEDEVDTSAALSEGLKQSGATIILAGSAAEALQVLFTQSPDVLVSDIGMPDMDGYELIRRIRTEGPASVQNIPALALTAFATDDDKQRSARAGYQAYLAKPVSIEELINVLARLGKTNRS